MFGVRVVRYFIPAKSRPQRPNRGNARVTDRQRDSSRAVECENAVKSRSFSVCFPGARSTTRVLRTARARTVRTLLTERVSHRTPLSPLRRALERHARARAPHASRPYSANPRTTDPARTSSHAMPAVSKAGAGAPKRAAAAPAIVEDPSTLVPCPVITAHPNGFVERTEPERETHEVRCVLPTRSRASSRQRHIARLGRARAAPRVPRGVSRHAPRKPGARRSRRRARARLAAHAPIRRARRPRVPAPSRPHRFSNTRRFSDLRARGRRRRHLGLNTRTEKNPKLTVRFTRIKTSPTQRVQARQEEAFVQPGGVDVRQGFFRQAFRRERR